MDVIEEESRKGASRPNCWEKIVCHYLYVLKKSRAIGNIYEGYISYETLRRRELTCNVVNAAL